MLMGSISVARKKANKAEAKGTKSLPLSLFKLSRAALNVHTLNVSTMLPLLPLGHSLKHTQHEHKNHNQ